MKNKQDYEWGIYKGKLPYLLRLKGDPSIIIFEPSRELVKNVTHRIDDIIKTYNMILPAKCSLCVLGYDPNLPVEYTAEEVAHTFADFIKKKYRPGIVMGISYGGFISIPFAALHPELTQKMILMVSAYAASPDGIQLMKDFIHEIDGENQYGVVQKFYSLILGTPLRLLFTFLTWLKRKDYKNNVNPASTFINAYNYVIKTNGINKKYLPEINASTLIIGGDKDPFFNNELFKETEELIPDSKLSLYKNQGHFVAIEKMKSVKKELADFIL
ncbi:MAG: alpha/beta hydrolase [Bacteroidota bacterium]